MGGRRGEICALLLRGGSLKSRQTLCHVVKPLPQICTLKRLKPCRIVSVDLICVWPCIINVDKVIQKNQLDATITIYWSTRSAQHVSGNLLPVFRSVRLRFLQHMVSCCCGRQGFGELQRGTTCTVRRKLFDSFLHTVHVVPRCRSPNPCLPQQQDTICCKNLSLTLLKTGKRLPETCWADLVDQ